MSELNASATLDGPGRGRKSIGCFNTDELVCVPDRSKECLSSDVSGKRPDEKQKRGCLLSEEPNVCEDEHIISNVPNGESNKTRHDGCLISDERVTESNKRSESESQIIDGDDCSDTIRRKLPEYVGIYVEGKIETLEVTYTIDTGATSTIVSPSVFQRIPESRRPTLHKTLSAKRLVNADGRPIAYKGQAWFDLHIGPVKIYKRLIVADIEDEVLLGADILLGDPSGPADLLMSEGRMILKGVSIPVMRVGIVNRVRKVYAADHYVIPEMSEAILDVFVEIFDDVKNVEQQNMLIEGTSTLVEDHSLILAPSLVDVANNATVKVRVLNPSNESISIKQDTVVGHAFQIEPHVEVLLSEEDESENTNFDQCRRVKLSAPNGCLSDKVREVKGKLLDSNNEPKANSEVPHHLMQIYDETTQNRSQSEKDQIREMLCQYCDVFSKDDYDLGLTNLIEHTIDTGDARPIKQRPRRIPMAFAGEDREAIQKLLQQGSVRPSCSPWSSPIVLVRKKDGSVRPCVDYRRVNAVTKKDAFPLPRTRDCLDAVAGATLYSTLDITSAYNQVPVKEQDIPKTAFVTRCGLYEYTTMPFGLSNSPATFQRVMELALSGLQWQICLIYLDDVIVFGKDFDEHICRLQEVLSRIKQANMKLKPIKCHFFQDEVKFLGHVVSKDGVLPNPDNIQKIVDWPVPRSVTEVRAFLGMGNYYRRFVKDFSKVVQHLTQLTKKEHRFSWTPECQIAFEKVKQVLTGPDVMAYPLESGGEFILDTDACDVSIGAVLSQKQDGVERVIAYGSRTLNKAERNYCVTDRELLAVKYFIEQYKHYLLGRKFVVRSDHQALKWLFSLKDPKNRIARWIEDLSAYDFVIEYRPGRRHGNADAMSRCPNPRECTCDEIDTLESMKCGPCKKCLKRAVDMQSSMLQDDGSIRSVGIHETVFKSWKFSSMKCPIQSFLLCLMGFFQLLVGSIFAKEKSGERGRTWQYNHSQDRCEDPLKLINDDGRLKPKLKRILGILNNFWKKKRSDAEKIIRFCRYRKGNDRICRYKDTNTGWALPYSMRTLRTKQMADEDIGPIIKWLEAGKRPVGPVVCASSPATRHYWNLWESLVIEDGVLFRNFHKKDGTGSYLQFLVPRRMKCELMEQMHNSIMSGHLGRKKTREKTLQRFYWFGLRDDVNSWVAKCHNCGAIKTPNKAAKAPLGSMPVGAPLDRLSTDILGPLPETPRGNRFILVVSDHFSKWIEIFAVPDFTAKTCAEKILNEVIARFGCPYDLHTDQGRNFESEIFSELCRMLEIRKTRTSAGNPRCNGQTERFNRTLVRMIKAYLKGQQREWDRNLGCLAAAYRATVHESTGLTPNLLMLGREVRLPAEVMFGSSTNRDCEISTYGEYVDILKSRMQHAHDVARKHLESAAKRHKDTYDAKLAFHQYKVGDFIWFLTDGGQLHIAPKLRCPYEGPYLVVERHNSLNYTIQLDAQGRKRVVHHNRLKPYLGDINLKWAKTAIKKVKKDHGCPL